MKLLRPISTILAVIMLSGIMFSGCLCRDKNRYYDDTKGFSIAIPSGWERGNAQGGADLIILPPAQDSITPFRPNMTVVVREEKEGMSLADYQLHTLEGIKAVLEGFQLVTSGEEKITGGKSGMLHFTYTLESIKVEVIQYTVLDKKKSVSVTFSAMPADFIKYRDAAEKTARSLDLL